MAMLQPADRDAVARALDVVPVLRRVSIAREALALGGRELLHAGPPLDGLVQRCAPIAHSAITAALFEGWAHSVDEARALLQDGGIRLRAAQDVGCVVPLADVLSPSMWVQEVCDLRHPDRRAYSPINGGNVHPLRVGVLDDSVLAQLRWVNGPFAEALAGALEEPVEVLPLADQGVQGGDDCHGRTGVATAALATALDNRWRRDAARCRAFFAQSSGIFLNVWMAATKCMLDAAQGVDDSTLLVRAGGNGVTFGITVASAPAIWHTVEATPPRFVQALPTGAIALGAIGDSAVVDCFGMGAMTTRASVDEVPSFAAVFGDATAMPRTVLAVEHPGLAHSRPLVGLCVTSIVDARAAPIVSLGVLDRDGIRGRLIGGYYRPPLELFDRVAAAVAA